MPVTNTDGSIDYAPENFKALGEMLVKKWKGAYTNPNQVRERFKFKHDVYGMRSGKFPKNPSDGLKDMLEHYRIKVNYGS